MFIMFIIRNNKLLEFINFFFEIILNVFFNN